MLRAHLEVHGHRGARTVRPENTIEGFEYAIGVGVDAIEFDVVVSRDDVVVVSHDPYLRSGVYIRQLMAAETGLPTLDDVLSIQGAFLFNMEAKVSEHTPENFAEMVLEKIRAHGVAERVQFQSFDFAILHRMKKRAPDLRMAALWEGDARSFVDIAREAETEIVAPEYVLVTRDRVNEAHEAGLRVIPWTVNGEDNWRRMVEAGVDGIITDDPAALIGYLRRAESV